MVEWSVINDQITVVCDALCMCLPGNAFSCLREGVCGGEEEEIIRSQWELFQDRSAFMLFPFEPLVLSVFLLIPDSQPPIIGKIVFPQIRIHCFVYL